MEQRHGKDPPLFGGNHDASGSQGGNGNHEESIHKGHAEGHRLNEGMLTQSHIASRSTPRPYMPTFLDAQRRDNNALNQESLGDEWESAEREYKLNTMEEGNAIKYATLYLMGKARDWWFHWMTTLGHEHVTSYRDFSQRLIDRFDREDPELHFRSLHRLSRQDQLNPLLRSFKEYRLWFLMCQNPDY
jgi:hypothetical protein